MIGYKVQQNYMPENVMIPHFGLDKRMVGVEIGVAAGSGSITMLMDIRHLTLYSIDSWKHQDPAEGIERLEVALPQAELDLAYETAKIRLKDYGPRSIIIRKESDDAINDVPAVIDYLFIDGDHNYGQVVKDLRNYAPKVQYKGIVAGHDYLYKEGVRRAVTEYFNGKVVHLGDDDVWWVYV